MTKRSGRSRWVEIYRVWDRGDLGRMQQQHAELTAIVQAFAKVGRVVRVEPGKYSSTSIVITARRA